MTMVIFTQTFFLLERRCTLTEEFDCGSIVVKERTLNGKIVPDSIFSSSPEIFFFFNEVLMLVEWN